MPIAQDELRRELQQLQKQDAANQLCADCGAPKPTWASKKLGVFICENCAGLHRRLGTHITEVRSVRLDNWEPAWLDLMRRAGNAKAKAYFEHSVPDEERFSGGTVQVGGDRLDKADAARLERWIRAKYEERRYVPTGAPSWDDLLVSSSSSSSSSAPAGGGAGAAAPSSAEAPLAAHPSDERGQNRGGRGRRRGRQPAEVPPQPPPPTASQSSWSKASPWSQGWSPDPQGGASTVPSYWPASAEPVQAKADLADAAAPGGSSAEAPNTWSPEGKAPASSEVKQWPAWPTAARSWVPVWDDATKDSASVAPPQPPPTDSVQSMESGRSAGTVSGSPLSLSAPRIEHRPLFSTRDQPVSCFGCFPKGLRRRYPSTSGARRSSVGSMLRVPSAPSLLRGWRPRAEAYSGLQEEFEARDKAERE